MASVTETTQIAARVPVELAEQLQRVAEDKDRTVSYEVRQAIKAHVDKHLPGPVKKATAA